MDSNCGHDAVRDAVQAMRERDSRGIEEGYRSMTLPDIITPEELRDELDYIKRKGTQQEAKESVEKLRDYGIALSRLDGLGADDFMCMMGVLEAIRRILERKAKPAN